MPKDDNQALALIMLFAVLFGGLFGYFIGMGVANDKWRDQLVDNPKYIDAVRASVKAKRDEQSKK